MTTRTYDPEPLRALAISETGFVFDPRTGHSYSVNPTGLAVLSAMKEGLPLDAIISRLREEFEAEASAVEDDIEGFLALLREYGLVGRGVATESSAGAHP